MENQEGVENFDAILDKTDSIMVSGSRGTYVPSEGSDSIMGSALGDVALHSEGAASPCSSHSLDIIIIYL